MEKLWLKPLCKWTHVWQPRYEANPSTIHTLWPTTLRIAHSSSTTASWLRFRVDSSNVKMVWTLENIYVAAKCFQTVFPWLLPYLYLHSFLYFHHHTWTRWEERIASLSSSDSFLWLYAFSNPLPAPAPRPKPQNTECGNVPKAACICGEFLTSIPFTTRAGGELLNRSCWDKTC